MITTNKTNNPIVSVYDEHDVKNFHLKPNAEPKETYYFNRESLDNNTIDLNDAFVLPYIKDKFNRYIISGASGAGKTTLLSNIITQFNQVYKGNVLIIYISSLQYDKFLDEVFKKLGKNNILKLTHKNFINNNPLLLEKVKSKKNEEKRTKGALSLDNQAKQEIKKKYNNIDMYNKKKKLLTPEEEKKKEEKERLNEIREKIINTPFINLDTLREFIKKYYDKREVLCVFDDCESMPNDGNNKIIKSMIMTLQHSILTAGRRHKDDETNINFIGVVHNLISGDMLRIIRSYINECNYLCFSLRATSKGQIDKICDKYGLIQFKETLQRLKNEGVGWIFISVNYPFYILCDKEIIPIV